MSRNEIKVLVVEDNPADFRLVSEMLTESVSPFFTIFHANLVDEAIKILRKDKFDIILLDINLPDSRGLEGLEKITLQEQGIPIIVLTGLNDQDVGLQAIQRQASDYLIKGEINRNLLVRSILYSVERREGESRYRSLIEMSPEAIFVNRENKIAFVNQAALQLLGASTMEQIAGKSLFDLFCPDPQHQICEEIQRVLEGLSAPLIEAKILRCDGTTVNVEVVASPFFEKGVRSVQVLVRDITVRKQAGEVLKRDKEMLEGMVKKRSQELMGIQVELERAKRLSDIGTLAATVAHELRNPLAAIGMAAALIKRKAKDTASIEKHLKAIDKKVMESDQIINNLLFYSRLRPPHNEEISIAEILQECIDLAKKQSNKAVVVDMKHDPIKKVLINADPLQMREVFSNLINNAFDAIPNMGGNVEIEMIREQEFIKIFIRDNGEGISKENLDKIFDPFFTTKAKGTGLGLTVCYRILSMHGGSIGFTSEPGKGTTVVVNLPQKTNG
ncbi:MAG: response regulator [Candidatus Omnitrophica bacterium]|nr:response regulator [Candidatus Omnitrophota bacterium]